jgi:thiol-disulfide isomerase/thioredoxin
MTTARRSALAWAAPLVAAATLLTACGATQSGTSTTTASAPAAASPTSDTPSPQASTATPPPKESSPSKGVYIDYATYSAAPGDYADTNTVLFFSATWCPTCQITEKDIAANMENLPDNLTLVHVDYDSAGDLRQQYEIRVQHTFVQVDSSGAAIKSWTGSPTVADIQSKVAA